jgi:hypothetical protein
MREPWSASDRLKFCTRGLLQRRIVNPFVLDLQVTTTSTFFCPLQCILIQCHERPVSHVESVGTRVSIHTRESMVCGYFIVL